MIQSLGIESEFTRGVPLPLPPIPELPDNDPVEALKMLRNYVRLILDYISPLKIGLGLLVCAAIGSGAVYYFANLDSLISWSAEFVPMAFAVVGIIFSVKRLREEHHFAVIALLLIVGVLGTVVLHLSRTHSEAEHAKEIAGLRERMDSVGDQNTQLLKAFLTKPILTSQEAEMGRRQNIQKALRSEYVLSHENISPGLLAGTELPPADWMNKRLHELGEQWTVTPPKSLSGAPVQPAEGHVVVAVAIGDDNAIVIPMKFDQTKIGTNIPQFDCIAPFICYTEDQLKATIVNLDFRGKKYRRLFFAVANPSNALISKSTVKINLSPLDENGKVKGISLYRLNQSQDGQQHIGVEYNQNETADIVPYSRTNSPIDFVIDLEADEDCKETFVMVFAISASNLTLHVITVPIHIVRH